LQEKQGDGQSAKEHLKSLWRQTGLMPDQLKSFDLPESLAYIWDDFIELNSARTSNGYSMNPLTFLEIDAWQRLTGKFTDIELIKMLDRTLLDYQSKQEKDK
jgi:hypothetical protein